MAQRDRQTSSLPGRDVKHYRHPPRPFVTLTASGPGVPTKTTRLCAADGELRGQQGCRWGEGLR